MTTLVNDVTFGNGDGPFQYEQFENERWAKIPILPPSSCVMFFGKRGSGKSAVMAKMGKDEANLGKKVWYWPPDYQFKYGEPIDLLTLAKLPTWLRDGALLLDEIQILASNLRTISTANQMIGSILQQVRKRGLNVYGTSNQPGRIDGTVALQTDYHYNCFMMEDQRCASYGYHIPSCDDHVRVRWVDTNGLHGYDRRFKDGRRRGRFVIWKIRDVYATYNTGAIADLADVMSVTKQAILDQKLDDGVGMSTAELTAKLRNEWIPALVKSGTKRAVPSVLANTFNEQFGLSLDPRTLGKALREIGIPSVRLNEGRFAVLPPEEHLDLWIRTGDWPRD